MIANNVLRCIIRYKDTNLKAIHNHYLQRMLRCRLYYPIQRYKFESNSQLVARRDHSEGCCIIRYKDTNLKAIHNSDKLLNKRLYYPIQRYKFESNSQPAWATSEQRKCCIIRYKDTNLKAIHNSLTGWFSAELVVSIMPFHPCACGST